MSGVGAAVTKRRKKLVRPARSGEPNGRREKLGKRSFREQLLKSPLAGFAVAGIWRNPFIFGVRGVR